MRAKHHFFVDPNSGDINVANFYNYARSHNRRESLILPQDCVQAFDVAFRYPPLLHFEQVNRSFFHDKEPFHLDWHLDLWYGHFQSLLIGSECGVTLNMDRKSRKS